jgi:ATP-dependent RNA helicase DeaD
VGRGYAADRLHGDLNQIMRERVMRNFRNGTIEILVATDVAARGLDVNDIDLIVNFELPYDCEDYVHRIGRTGRAGKSGKAVSLVAGREIYLIQRIQRFINTRINRAKVPSQEEKPPVWIRPMKSSSSPSKAANTPSTSTASSACSMPDSPPRRSPAL